MRSMPSFENTSSASDSETAPVWQHGTATSHTRERRGAGRHGHAQIIVYCAPVAPEYAPDCYIIYISRRRVHDILYDMLSAECQDLTPRVAGVTNIDTYRLWQVCAWRCTCVDAVPRRRAESRRAA